ncbi:hypothetical protein [Nocardioides sp. GXZ039]|uniref:hypothetical protein n=1 Tax=Nocardioides sp. GXZ039 TaxID=3136018 RepID=UPI0030F3BAEC
MTEPLTHLMNREAEHLEIPAPPAAAVLTRGRQLRRRRRSAIGAAALAAVIALGSGVALLRPGDDRRGLDPAPATADGIGAAFAIGNVVYVDGGAHSATVPARAVQALYLTSAGLVVQHEDPGSRRGDPRFSLVTADGRLTPLSTEPKARDASADPALPYLGWIERRGAVTTAVVHDVATDRDVHRVRLPVEVSKGAVTWMTGQYLVVDAAEGAAVVDLATGTATARPSDELPRPGPIAGTDLDTDVSFVIDPTTGERLAEAEASESPDSRFAISPNGRYARWYRGDGESFVYDLADGTRVRLDSGAAEFGWTPADVPFAVTDGGELITCVPTTGECSSRQLDLVVRPNQTPPPVGGVDKDPSDDLLLAGDVQ